VSPRSRDPAKAAIQQANLVPGGGRRFVRGNGAAARHSGYRRIVGAEFDAIRSEIFAALADSVPLRPGGVLPVADELAVAELTEALGQLRSVREWLRSHGWLDQKSNELLPAVAREEQLSRRVLDYSEALGLTPRSRMKLGVDLVRGLDVASALSAAREEENPAVRRALLQAAGLDVDGDDPEDEEDEPEPYG
jgi:hypothetical protein